MIITPERISAVIAEIYKAVEDPEGFTPVVRHIRTLLNGSSAMLFTPTCGPESGGFGVVDHFDAELFNHYCADYRELDPWAREAARRNYLRTGVTATDEMLISQRDMQKEPFFNDVQRPMDVARVCCSVVTSGEGTSLPFTYLSIFRGVGSRPFGEAERRAAQMLIPHVLQALRLAVRLNVANTGLASAYAALHALDVGVLLVGPTKTILFMNLVAERLCVRERGLVISWSSTGSCALHACSGREDLAVQQSIDAVCRVHKSTSTAAPVPARTIPISVHGPSGEGTLLVTALPLPSTAPTVGAASARAIIIVEVASAKPQPAQNLFITLFRFTPAEFRVAQALLTDEQPKAIAQMLRVSENTIRTHIRSLYSKTNTRRMPALISLLSRLADTQASAASLS